jgi:hypothetical protein
VAPAVIHHGTNQARPKIKGLILASSSSSSSSFQKEKKSCSSPLFSGKIQMYSNEAVSLLERPCINDY